MSTSIRKAKIKWQCRRGMLELDLVLMRFIDIALEQLTDKELNAFELILNEPDPVLYSWLMGSTAPDDGELRTIVELIKLHYNTK